MIFARSTFCTAAFRSGRAVQRDVPEFLERPQLFAEIEPPGDVELLDRRAVVHKHQKLDLGRPQIHRRGFEVGFELNPLQFQAVQIHLGDVAGLEARAVRRRVRGPSKSGSAVAFSRKAFACRTLHERGPQVEQQTALLIQISRFRDGGRFFGLIAPQLPLVLAFVQITDAG